MKLLAVLPVRPQGKPRRSHGKIGFQQMAKIIGGKWRARSAETRQYYDELARQDKERYEREIKAYQAKRKMLQKVQKEHESAVLGPLFLPPRPASMRADPSRTTVSPEVGSTFHAFQEQRQHDHPMPATTMNSAPYYPLSPRYNNGHNPMPLNTMPQEQAFFEPHNIRMRMMTTTMRMGQQAPMPDHDLSMMQ